MLFRHWLVAHVGLRSIFHQRPEFCLDLLSSLKIIELHSQVLHHHREDVLEVKHDRGYLQNASAQELPEDTGFRTLLVKNGPTRYPTASVPLLG